MTPQPAPTLELIARLQELEVAILAMEGPVAAEISPWYATYTEDAARLVRCLRLEAERLRNLSNGEWPDWAVEAGDAEQGQDAVLETAASATDVGDEGPRMRKEA